MSNDCCLFIYIIWQATYIAHKFIKFYLLNVAHVTKVSDPTKDILSKLMKCFSVIWRNTLLFLFRKKYDRFICLVQQALPQGTVHFLLTAWITADREGKKTTLHLEVTPVCWLLSRFDLHSSNDSYFELLQFYACI